MLKKIVRDLASLLGRFRSDESGGTLVYIAFFAFIAVGAGALAVDLGRMTVVRAQMQNHADASAMAAAVQLDGRDGAQARAQQMALNAARSTSRLTSDSNSLSVQTVNFDPRGGDRRRRQLVRRGRDGGPPG